MKTLRIAFDIDGVLNDCRRALLRALAELYGLVFTVEEWTVYKMEECMGITKDMTGKVIELGLSESYFSYMEPCIEMINIVKMLYAKTDKVVPIITSRKDLVIVKKFLDERIVKGVFPYILRCKDRDMDTSDFKLECMDELRCDFLVDDSPFIAEAVSARGKVALLVDHRYNRSCKYGFRVRNLWDIYHLGLVMER